MDINSVDPADAGTCAALVELQNAASKVDAPWQHPVTLAGKTATLRHGWDGEPPYPYALRVDGRVLAAGEIWASEWDNKHLAWLELEVHPDARRRGLGSALWDFLVEQARQRGRTSVGADGWDLPAVHAFAARHGLQQKSAAINRRQHVEASERSVYEGLRAEARPHAAAYELLHVAGPVPDELRDAVAQAAAAINDAPTDDLDIEDEVFTAGRLTGYEQAQLAHGHRWYRVIARHRETGDLAGQTVVVVEGERPHIGHQHDTSVVAAHRGHRLGTLLKADMLCWLTEVEPALRTVDTWNAESNAHMIAVNERLGYRVLGRGIQFQRSL